MPIVCDGCGEYVEPEVERSRQTRNCGSCGYEEPFLMLPLFIVTGASGTGKTTVVKKLRKVLPDCAIFDTDEMHAADWEQASSNWLRVAYQIAQSGRCTVLCGTFMPWDIEKCDHFRYFRQVYYLNLHCGDAAREARLRARPAWRGVTDSFIGEHQRFAQWLIENASTAYDPPMPIVDTTNAEPGAVAVQVGEWVNAWK